MITIKLGFLVLLWLIPLSWVRFLGIAVADLVFEEYLFRILELPPSALPLAKTQYEYSLEFNQVNKLIS